MAKLLSTIIDGFLSSKNFVSGFVGSGWKIWKSNDRYKLEIDDLVIRNTMTVFELMISKIRAVKGALGISQASGKVKSVREDEENYYLEIEEEVSFKANDIVRCMEFTGNQRSYWVIVSGADGKEITIPKSEFGETIPLPGDELIQFGNTTDKTRQSAIYLHADENGVPAIDVLFDIHEKSFDGCVKVRLGGALPGEAEEYKGFFCKNGLIKSVNEAGEEMYKLRPDGSGFVAKGNINWDADGNGSIFHESIYWDTDGFHFGSGVKLTWDNLSDDAKANLKGEKGDTGPAGAEGPAGKDANLLPWVEDWDNNKTQIGGEAVISPKIFSGRKNADNTLTGVALGRGVVMVDGMEKTGIFGLKNGKLTFSIDAETGDAYFEGEIMAEKGKIGGFTIGKDRIGSVGDMDTTRDFSLYKDFIKFGNGHVFAAIGTNTLPSSRTITAAARFENNTIHNDTEINGEVVRDLIDNIALYLSCSGALERNEAKNYSCYAAQGVGYFADGIEAIPRVKFVSLNDQYAIITNIKDYDAIFVTPQVSDDYIELKEGYIGQKITIINCNNNCSAYIKNSLARTDSRLLNAGGTIDLIYVGSYLTPTTSRGWLEIGSLDNNW